MKAFVVFGNCLNYVNIYCKNFLHFTWKVIMLFSYKKHHLSAFNFLTFLDQSSSNPKLIACFLYYPSFQLIQIIHYFKGVWIMTSKFEKSHELISPYIRQTPCEFSYAVKPRAFRKHLQRMGQRDLPLPAASHRGPRALPPPPRGAPGRRSSYLAEVGLSGCVIA